MCRSTEEYNEAMSGQAQYEAEAEQEQKYQEFLGGLIEAGRHFEFAMHIAIDLLNSDTFKKSGLTATEFLSKRLADKQKPNDPNEDFELPF